MCFDFFFRTLVVNICFTLFMYIFIYYFWWRHSVTCLLVYRYMSLVAVTSSFVVTCAVCLLMMSNVCSFVGDHHVYDVFHGVCHVYGLLVSRLFFFLFFFYWASSRLFARALGMNVVCLFWPRHQFDGLGFKHGCDLSFDQDISLMTRALSMAVICFLTETSV